MASQDVSGGWGGDIWKPCFSPAPSILTPRIETQDHPLTGLFSKVALGKEAVDYPQGGAGRNGLGQFWGQCLWHAVSWPLGVPTWALDPAACPVLARSTLPSPHLTKQVLF